MHEWEKAQKKKVRNSNQTIVCMQQINKVLFQQVLRFLTVDRISVHSFSVHLSMTWKWISAISKCWNTVFHVVCSSKIWKLTENSLHHSIHRTPGVHCEHISFFFAATVSHSYKDNWTTKYNWKELQTSKKRKTKKHPREIGFESTKSLNAAALDCYI